MQALVIKIIVQIWKFKIYECGRFPKKNYLTERSEGGDVLSHQGNQKEKPSKGTRNQEGWWKGL